MRTAVCILCFVMLPRSAGCVAAADPFRATAPDVFPADFQDAAFGRYVDLKFLGRAWEEMDPAALADAGLQLAEGERVLLRPHKGITAASVLALATKVAAEKNDKATLDRLTNAAEARSDKNLVEQVATARKLAGGSRAPDPALSVSVEQTTPEAFALYKERIARIKAAQLAGNRAALEQMEKEAAGPDALSEAQKKYLAKAVADALAALPKNAKPDETALALAKLAAATRCGGPRDYCVSRSKKLDIWYTASDLGLRLCSRSPKPPAFLAAV
jgi:hypothetical protein